MRGYLLDTNVVSELRKGDRSNAALLAWYSRQDKRDLYLSVITLAELRRGVALIQGRDARQAEVLDHWCSTLQRGFSKVGHLLTIWAAEATAWGQLQAIRPLPVLDAFPSRDCQNSSSHPRHAQRS